MVLKNLLLLSFKKFLCRDAILIKLCKMAVARGKSMYVKVSSKGYAFIMNLPCSPLISFSFVLWVTLGLFLNLLFLNLSPPLPQWKRDVMQHPIYLETIVSREI